MRKKSIFIALLMSATMVFSFSGQKFVNAYVIDKNELKQPNQKDIIPDTILNWVIRCAIGNNPKVYVPLTEDSLKGLKEIYYSESDHYDLYEFNVFVKNIEGIQYASEVERIILPYNKISDITPISNLIKVNKIILNDNLISDISALSNLKNIKILNLFDNRITSLEPLSKMTELESLNLGFNRISNVEILSNLSKLKYVDLSHNNINDISSLKNLKEVETLLIGNNNIKDISPISNMTKLKELEITSTGISDISCLKNLRNLEILRISKNSNIKDIAPLTNLTKLKKNELWLGDTGIADQKENLFKVIEVNKKINAFKANYITYKDKERVEEARKAYNLLPSELKKYIPELRIIAAEDNIKRIENGEAIKRYPQLAEFDKQAIERDINLKVLTAKVQDEKGNPLNNITFNVKNEFGDLVKTIKSDNKGIIRYNIMPYESYMKYEIRLSDKENYKCNLQNITFQTNGKAQIDKINGDIVNGEEIKFILTKNHSINKLDKTILENAIKEAESKDQNDYTSESYDELKNVINLVKKLLVKENITQEEIDSNVKKIQNAIKGLVKKSNIEQEVDRRLLRVKVIESNGQPLSGVKFQLSNDYKHKDNKPITLISNKNGVVEYKIPSWMAFMNFKLSLKDDRYDSNAKEISFRTDKNGGIEQINNKIIKEISEIKFEVRNKSKEKSEVRPLNKICKDAYKKTVKFVKWGVDVSIKGVKKVVQKLPKLLKSAINEVSQPIHWILKHIN